MSPGGVVAAPTAEGTATHGDAIDRSIDQVIARQRRRAPAAGSNAPPSTKPNPQAPGRVANATSSSSGVRQLRRPPCVGRHIKPRRPAKGPTPQSSAVTAAARGGRGSGCSGRRQQQGGGEAQAPAVVHAHRHRPNCRPAAATPTQRPTRSIPSTRTRPSAALPVDCFESVGVHESWCRIDCEAKAEKMQHAAWGGGGLFFSTSSDRLGWQIRAARAKEQLRGNCVPSVVIATMESKRV